MIMSSEKKAEKEAVTVKYTKEQLLASERYRNRRDLVSALLIDGEMYSLEEAEQIMGNFLKGRVR